MNQSDDGVRRDRIDYAIQVLRNVRAEKAERFDIRLWANVKKRMIPGIFGRRISEIGWDDTAPVVINGCATHGCAIGWIASDPMVIKDGFTLQVSKMGSVFPTYLDMIDSEAIAAYFGIDRDLVQMLFMPSAYTEKKGKEALDEVIGRMEIVLTSDRDNADGLIRELVPPFFRRYL